VIETDCLRRGAASATANLPSYRVVGASDPPDADDRVVVESTVTPGRPMCSVVSTRARASPAVHRRCAGQRPVSRSACQAVLMVRRGVWLTGHVRGAHD